MSTGLIIVVLLLSAAVKEFLDVLLRKKEQKEQVIQRIADELKHHKTETQLNEIQVLINNDAITIRQAELDQALMLDQTLITLVLLRKLVSIGNEMGREMGSDEQLIIETEARAKELRNTLSDKLKRQMIVEKEQASINAEAAEHILEKEFNN